MMQETGIRKQIPNALGKTDFPGLGEKYQGKVRDNYTFGERRIIITTDRISAFDVVLGTIPFKGQVLNQLAAYWFDKTSGIAKNHVIDVPDPNVMIVRVAKPIPVEVVVRRYLTGSAWRDYAKGNAVSGIRLPEGMKKDQKFAKPMITPSTKEEGGKHDRPISREEVVSTILDERTYSRIEKTALALFESGTKLSTEHGLILVDTKYEFGITDDKLMLIDEIHTPDSSRFWVSETYEENFRKGIEQQMLDKEFIRQWLIEKGFMGEGNPPELTEDLKINAAKRYIKLFETISGQEFVAEPGDVGKRVKDSLKKGGYLK